ncbi:MAG: hypothetical protein FWG66_06555 [Spirochaetes bacterium]|nr:hypothetical protein [Spirochaetota bacterium]
MANRLKLTAAAATLALALFVALPGAVYAQGFGNRLDELGFSMANPPHAVLGAFGFLVHDSFALGISRFNRIRDAGSGGYQGWTLDGEEWGDAFLIMAWTGRSMAQANIIAFAVEDIFGSVEERGYLEDGVRFSAGSRWVLFWNPTHSNGDSGYLPAETVFLLIYADRN